MTDSVWVDLIVVGVAILVGISGYRQGAIASALAFIGVLTGAVAGILLAPKLMEQVDSRETRLFIGITLLVVLVVSGQVAGLVLGRAARGGMRSQAARAVDSVVGTILQVVAVIIAAWLLAIPVSNSGPPKVASAVRDSSVLGVVDDVAPQWLRDLPNDFSALLDNSGLPEVIGPFGRAPVTSVAPPDDTTARAQVVSRVRPGVVKIVGVAPSCRQELEGSGFVVSPERVMTNAHVVAGTRRLTVEAESGEQLTARVVLFDYNNDIAVLDVPGLTAPALGFAGSQASTGDDAISLGFPGGGPFTATAVRVRNVIRLSGPNIYSSQQVRREVYTVRGQIRQGNSGGPLINLDGKVLGVVFGASQDPADETGFVLTADQVSENLTTSANRSARVSTRTCTGS